MQFELVVSTFLCIIILMMVDRYNSDRRYQNLISELTDKIKAKDFTEYVEQTKPAPQFEPVHNDDEDLYEKEIEAMKR